MPYGGDKDFDQLEIEVSSPDLYIKVAKDVMTLWNLLELSMC